jgi:hypothetical protein
MPFISTGSTEVYREEAAIMEKIMELAGNSMTGLMMTGSKKIILFF